MRHYFPHLLDWLKQWLEVADNNVIHTRISFTRFEDFAADNRKFLSDLFRIYGFDISPENVVVPERKVGKRHFRSGKVDEWRDIIREDTNHFCRQVLPAKMIDRFGWQN